MTTNLTQPDPGAKDSAPQFPAESELVSGHDVPYVSPEELDARTFADIERSALQWSYQ